MPDRKHDDEPEVLEDNFDSAGDYLGSGDPSPDDPPLSESQVERPSLSVGNEPYRTPPAQQEASS